MPSKSDTSALMRPLEGQVALVTGASRGIGRGIALQLADAGCIVYITGRRPQAALGVSYHELPSLEKTAKDIKERGGEAIPVFCDHGNTDDVKRLFTKIDEENQGNLDILVNNVFSGVPAILENAGRKFFECNTELWDQLNDVGLRSHYICAVFASRLMTKKHSGLIVNVSSIGGLKYFFNVPYGVGKAALDRMSADMAHELKSYNVAVVSVWPGFTKTELAEKAMQTDIIPKLTKLNKTKLDIQWKGAETPEFTGKAVVALAKDRNVLKKTGKIYFTTDLAEEYRFMDSNGLMPPNVRSVRSLLEFCGFRRLAVFIPSFIKIPKFILHFVSYKF